MKKRNKTYKPRAVKDSLCLALYSASLLLPDERERLKLCYWGAWGKMLASQDWNSDDWNHVMQCLLIAVDFAIGKHSRQIGVECVPDFDAAIDTLLTLAYKPDVPDSTQVCVVANALELVDRQYELCSSREFMATIAGIKNKYTNYNGCEIGAACVHLIKTRPGPLSVKELENNEPSRSTTSPASAGTNNCP